MKNTFKVYCAVWQTQITMLQKLVKDYPDLEPEKYIICPACNYPKLKRKENLYTCTTCLWRGVFDPKDPAWENKQILKISEFKNPTK